MSGEFDPTLELGLPPEKMVICGCRGFLSRNDSTRDICAHFIPDGEHFYDLLSRYDCLVTYVLGRDDLVAGNVPKYALPFLKAYGATNYLIYKAAKESLRLVDNAPEVMKYLADLLPTYITTSSYDQALMALEEKLRTPLCESEPTEYDYTTGQIGRIGSKVLREMAAEMNSLEIPDVTYQFNVPTNLDKRDIKIIQKLDHFLGDGMTDEGRLAMESCQPMDSSKKAYRILDLRRQRGIDLDGTIYIGDDHTDYQSLSLVKDSSGLAMSFNGSEIAIRGSNITVISESATVGAVLAGTFYDKGIQAVLDLADKWDRGFADSGDFPDRHLADRLLSEKKFPEVYATDDVDLDDLCEKSEKMRDRMIKGEI
jgi:energy-converting hydrogenase A subunit R